MSSRLESEYPTLASIPIMLYDNEAVSIKDLNAKFISFDVEAEKSRLTKKLLSFEAEKSHVDEGYVWALAVAYYSKLASLPSPMVSIVGFEVSIVGFGIPTMSPNQALDEVRNNTETGAKLVRMYAGLRQEVLSKVAQL